MESVDVSLGTFMIGLVKEEWSTLNVVHGKEHLEYVTPIISCDLAPLNVRILWTYADVKGDLRPYLHLIKQFNDGIANEIPPRTIINNIVREHFIDNEGKTPLYNTSLSDDVLLTIFLQSVHISIRAAFTFNDTSTVH